MGNLWDIQGRYKAAMNNEIRGQRCIWGGGGTPSTVNTIDYVELSSAGNAVDFGDLTAVGIVSCTMSNNTRCVFAGRSTAITTIDYVQISSLGNAADFGDLTVARQRSGATTSPTRCVFAGGSGSPTYVDTIDYVEILTTGNAVDFGNLVRGASRCYGSFSNAHGGL